MFGFCWLFVWVALHSWKLWLAEWKLKKWETYLWCKVLLKMFSIQGSHSYSTDLSMMMLPAWQTMGLPTLRNVLVPGQGCVAYLRKNLLVIVLEFLFAFMLVLCISLYLSLYLHSIAVLYLNLAKVASHTWPGKIIDHCLQQEKYHHLEVTTTDKRIYILGSHNNRQKNMMIITQQQKCFRW